MKFKKFSKDGSSQGEKELEHFPVFEGEHGIQAIRQVLIAYNANARQGNACTKTRAEVSGTGKKPFRQKGTGRGRQGSMRSPQWRTGGVVFGPKPRDFSHKINRRVKALAFSRVLYDSANNNEISLIESWDVPSVKTKLFEQIIVKIYPLGNVLIIDDCFDKNTLLSARNINRITLSNSSNVNVKDLVHFKNIIASEKSINTLVARAIGGLA